MDDTEARVSESPPPPLGIIHLLGWTAITAVGLSIVQNLSFDEPRPSPFDLVNRIWFAAMFGISFGTVLLMVARRWRGIVFPIQPGEFWLVAWGIANAIHIVGWCAFVGVYGTRSVAGLWVFSLGYFIALAPDYWAARCVEPTNWKALFWTRFGFNAIQALLAGGRFDGDMLNFYWVIVALETAVTLPWLYLLIRSDRMHQIRRGWLHRLGLTCWVLASLHTILWWAWVFLLPM